MRNRRSHSQPQRRADPARGAAAARIPRLRLGGRRGDQRQHAAPAQLRPRRCARAACARARARRPHRHRPHALGDARRALRAQRPPACLGRRLGGAQRHHREPRRDAGAAHGPRLRIRFRHPHRSHRASGALAPEVRRSLRCGAPSMSMSRCSRSPPRRRSSADGARCAVGTEPDVPRKTRSRSTAGV